MSILIRFYSESISGFKKIFPAAAGAIILKFELQILLSGGNNYIILGLDLDPVLQTAAVYIQKKLT
jgi:hypothetical protein